MRRPLLRCAAAVLLLLAGACSREERPSGPCVETLEPDVGSVDGGDTVRILGSGFAEGMYVTFGGLACPSVSFVGERELAVETPPGSEGPADVSVTHPGGLERVVPGGFHYQDPSLAPRIDAVEPPYGLSAGGEAVTITGVRFQDGAVLLLGGEGAGAVSVTDATTVTAVTPGLPEGCHAVRLVNPDGREALLADGYASADWDPESYEVLNLTNHERRTRGLGWLVPHPILAEAARGHCQDMIDRAFFDHTNPDGEGPADRAAALGYPSGYVGENIAAGYATPQAVMTAWMNSTGHRANILRSTYTEMGAGCRRGGSYGIYWTQVFGRR